MWQPLSKLLNLIGRIQYAYRPSRVGITVGKPTETDAMGSLRWKEFTETEALYRAWGPPPQSPWEPYHCVPLFAALATIAPERIGPTDPIQVRSIEGNGHLGNGKTAQPLGREWAEQRSWVILDLPGPTSVAAAVRLMAGGFQPVCTFDNWPHEAGVIRPEFVLAHLLRYAAHASELRMQLTPQSPPVWICDRDRLGNRPAKIKEFDNRYYLDDSILPSPETLRAQGIEQIICIVPMTDNLPRDDLRAYFRDLRKDNFHNIHGVAFQDPALQLFRFREEMYTIDFKTSGYHRSDAGGFGMLIPEPSSSGG